MRQVKTITVTLTIETECEDMDLIAHAICSEFAGYEVEYSCVEGLPDGTDSEPEECSIRIVSAESEGCRTDAGTSDGYHRPGATIITTLEGRTFARP